MVSCRLVNASGSAVGGTSCGMSCGGGMSGYLSAVREAGSRALRFALKNAVLTFDHCSCWKKTPDSEFCSAFFSDKSRTPKEKRRHSLELPQNLSYIPLRHNGSKRAWQHFGTTFRDNISGKDFQGMSCIGALSKSSSARPGNCPSGIAFADRSLVVRTIVVCCAKNGILDRNLDGRTGESWTGGASVRGMCSAFRGNIPGRTEGKDRGKDSDGLNS